MLTVNMPDNMRNAIVMEMNNLFMECVYMQVLIQVQIS